MKPYYKVICSDGGSWCTEMAKNITLDDARAYFVGQWFDVGVYPAEKMVKAVDVVQLGVTI